MSWQKTHQANMEQFLTIWHFYIQSTNSLLPLFFKIFTDFCREDVAHPACLHCRKNGHRVTTSSHYSHPALMAPFGDCAVLSGATASSSRPNTHPPVCKQASAVRFHTVFMLSDNSLKPNCSEKWTLQHEQCDKNNTKQQKPSWGKFIWGFSLAEIHLK